MPPDYVLTLLPVQIIGGVSVVAAVAWLWKTAIRPAFRWMLDIKARLDDFLGRPERDGLPAQPGVMARLEDYDDKIQGMTASLSELGDVLSKVKYHVMPNGGKSSWDAMGDRIDAVGEHVARLADSQLTLAGAVDRLREDKERAHEEMLRRIARIELPHGEES